MEHALLPHLQVECCIATHHSCIKLDCQNESVSYDNILQDGSECVDNLMKMEIDTPIGGCCVRLELYKHIAHDRVGGDPLTSCQGIPISFNSSRHECK